MSGSKRILFVDDDPAILAAIEKALRRDRQHWEMVFALGGEAGLVELRKTTFDVVVSDLEMPVVNGAVLLDAVKRESPQTARIVLSGSDFDLDSHGADEFIAKPCNTQTLRAAIERLLRRSGA